MTGSRGSLRFVAGCLAVALLLAVHAAAQQPGGPPPTPPRPAQPGPLPDAVPPLTPPVPVPGPRPSQPPPSFEVPSPPAPPAAPTVRQFNFKINPRTPVKDLLPAAPKAAPGGGPAPTDDLAKVPEVEFEAKPEKVTTDDKLVREAAHQLAKINHLNAKKADAFMAALLQNRPDLTGLPFVMGDDCRAHGDRLKHFTQAAQTVRQALGAGQVPANPLVRTSSNVQPTAPQPVPAPQAGSAPATGSLTLENFTVLQTADVIQGQQPQPFWKTYATVCEQEDQARERTDKEIAEHVTVARVAALTQMLAAESATIRLGLVKYLTGVPHVEATKALARMAIYSTEDDVRGAAITALKVRKEKDYTDVLVKGLRYPLPAVARRAAAAIARLERADLIPELVAVLDDADPRMPATKEVEGKSVVVVREVVKLNHHRNCMMCHAPAGSGTPNPSAILAEVAVQGQPLPTPAEGYRQSTPELMIRVDVTYLRPDFSSLMPVKDAHPWPDMQRFDFLVRERKLTDEEAAAYRDQLTPKEAGVLSPYHKAVLAALRDMTGKDAAPTAEAWRKLLNLPAKPTVTRG